jgi:hypothetical protein
MYGKGSRPDGRIRNVHDLLLLAAAMTASVVLNTALWIFRRKWLLSPDPPAPPSKIFPLPALAAMVTRRAAPGFSITCLACLLLLLQTMPAHAKTPEEQLKADMLYHFSLFVQWPDRAWPDATSPFIFCLLGGNTLQPWLQNHLRVGNRRVEIRQLGNTEEAAECQLLYIDRSEQPRLQQILARLRNMSVLTVSDIEDFCSQGGMIELLVEDQQMRFDLNTEKADTAGLKIDSALKRIARNVNCGKQE